MARTPKTGQIDAMYTVKKMGMDSNGNHSVWVSFRDGRAKKIQTLQNLPLTHRDRELSPRVIDEISDFVHARNINPIPRVGTARPRKKRDGRFNVWPGANMVGGRLVKGYNVEFLNEHIGWVKTKGEVDTLIEQYNAKRLPNPKRRAPAARKQNPTVERISHCVLQTHKAAQEAVCFTRSGEYARIIAGLMQKHAAPGVTFTVVAA